MSKPLTQKVPDFFLDLVFPKKCVSCGKLDTMFCERCLSKVTFLKTQNCPFCLKVTIRGRVCPSCRPKTSLTGVYVMAHFDGPLKEAIHKYKYEFIKALNDDFAEIAWPYLEDFGKKAVMTVVPSSPKRLSWRGYNQAHEVAKKLSASSNLKYYPELLKRTEYKIPQTQLKRKERFENVKNSFKINKKVDLKGKKVVIFDDLVTSGATLDACAREIRKMGAARVWGFVLARNK